MELKTLTLNGITYDSFPDESAVKTVNGIAPDKDGNVEIQVSGGNADYVLPVGGEELGGVKNGGNVVINADGTMTAPEVGGSSVAVDDEMSDTSENPVQNKVVKAYVDAAVSGSWLEVY